MYTYRPRTAPVCLNFHSPSDGCLSKPVFCWGQGVPAGWWSWSIISGGRTQRGASQAGRQLVSSALMQRAATSLNPFSSSCSSPDNIITWSSPNFIKDKLDLWFMTLSWDNEIFTVGMKRTTGAFTGAGNRTILAAENWHSFSWKKTSLKSDS